MNHQEKRQLSNRLNDQAWKRLKDGDYKNAISKEALKLLSTDQINRNADTDIWYEMDKEEFRAHIRKLKQG